LSELEPPSSPFSRRSVRLFAGSIAALLVLGAIVGAVTRGSGGTSHPTGTTAASTDTTLPLSKALPTTLASLMGLSSAHSKVAPRVALVDQHGHQVSLSALRSKAVLLTFLDADCTGICPVESAELRAAERDLGDKSAKVEVLVVNIDANHRSTADMARLARLMGLGGRATFRTLTGSLAALRSVWAAYGVQVQVDEVHDTVIYEPLIVFIDPLGHERYTATPSGFELASGRYVLPADQVTAFGRGIAHFAASLLPSST
jgi:cytochrome oxidase Cu insertion factor (SCO1/SenC/PrrC family)